MSADNGHHDDSSDNSDRGSNDAQQRYEDILSGSEFDENENGQKGWTYMRRNARGGEAYRGFLQRNLPEGAFKLDYNGVDSMLLDEATDESAQSLNKVRVKLFKTDKNQSISPAQALTAVLTFG